ncbi:uncharacterized protein LOC113229750 [Hyposmocoma kahamanoa]|uniref:uncharacterized protein LOC113229750 n=1 Tax=Hyposmocoma kahamanoa TaxID=1477025 RepID=UPI000E6D98F8|nr:uncharacterized protein LOC113229750 [Hyposmocoma kahamanoa]
MEKVYIFLALAIFVNVAVAMNLRHKRQSNGANENNLDERYGSDRPRDLPQWGNQWGNMNQPWDQNQWGNSGEDQNQQWPFPNQNGQNGGNWPNQNGQNGQNGGNWPNQNGQSGQNWPNQNGANGQTPPPTPIPNGSSTQSPQMMACISSCPVTPEYNPVCGSDGTTYSNPGRLTCAQFCGLNISQIRASRCPPTTTTAAPQFTTLEKREKSPNGIASAWRTDYGLKPSPERRPVPGNGTYKYDVVDDDDEIFVSLAEFMITLIWRHTSTGRIFSARYGKPYDSHDQFHHAFEHNDQDSWHNGAPEWDQPTYHRIHINNAHNRHPIVHRNDYQESREYWRQHHPVSYKYSPEMYTNYPVFTPKFPSHVMDTLPPVTPSRTVSSLQCIRSCPTAIEYNPVCGTDNVTYINPSSLECAKQCGIEVELQLKSTCPSTYTLKVESTQSTSTSSPTDTHLTENEKHWEDIPLTESPFYYMDHLESTEKKIFHANYDDDTRTPLTESTTSEPKHGSLANTDATLYTQRPKHWLDITQDSSDEDENIEIDVRNPPFDD